MNEAGITRHYRLTHPLDPHRQIPQSFLKLNSKNIHLESSNLNLRFLRPSAAKFFPGFFRVHPPVSAAN